MTTYASFTPTHAFAELGRIHLGENNMSQVLGRMSELAKQTIPGAEEVSVTLVQADQPSTAAFTGELALQLDESQYETGGGPCLAAAAGGETMHVTDMATEDRWPEYTPRAVNQGAGSSVSVGIPVQESVTAALNIYSTRTNAFNHEAVDLAVAFAGYAAVALVNAHLYTSTAARAEQMQDALAKLTHELLHDGLTGLPNQRLLADRLTQALARSKRAGTYVAVLFLDLDDFKTVNDTFGHAAGDQLLIAVANRLLQCLRDTDTCARMGGDEFVLVLEDLSLPSDGSRLAGRVTTALADGVVVGDHTIQVRASVGLAISSAGSDPATLLHEADTAMYRAKQAEQATDRRRTQGSDGDVPNTSLTEDDSGPGTPLHARRRTD